MSLSNKKLAALVQRHTLTLVPGTPEWDLVWGLVSANVENLNDIVDEDESRLSEDESRAQATDRAQLKVSRDLTARMDAFPCEMAGMPAPKLLATLLVRHPTTKAEVTVWAGDLLHVLESGPGGVRVVAHLADGTPVEFVAAHNQVQFSAV